MMQTALPVVPIATKEEKLLFIQLLRKALTEKWSMSATATFIKMAKYWNNNYVKTSSKLTKNETVTVFPKTAEQIGRYYKLWRVSQMKKAATKKAADSDLVKALQYNPGVVVQATFQAQPLTPANLEEIQDKANKDNDEDAAITFTNQHALESDNDDGQVSAAQAHLAAPTDTPTAQFGTVNVHPPVFFPPPPPPPPMPLYMTQTPYRSFPQSIPTQPIYQMPPLPIVRKKRGRKRCQNPDCNDDKCHGGYNNKYCEHKKKKG
jgi:hypothetical protein